MSKLFSRLAEGAIDGLAHVGSIFVKGVDNITANFADEFRSLASGKPVFKFEKGMTESERFDSLQPGMTRAILYPQVALSRTARKVRKTLGL